MDQSGHANILIVDDSRTVREEIKAALGAARPGLSFLEAENGQIGRAHV